MNNNAHLTWVQNVLKCNKSKQKSRTSFFFLFLLKYIHEDMRAFMYRLYF